LDDTRVCNAEKVWNINKNAYEVYALESEIIDLQEIFLPYGTGYWLKHYIELLDVTQLIVNYPLLQHPSYDYEVKRSPSREGGLKTTSKAIDLTNENNDNELLLIDLTKSPNEDAIQRVESTKDSKKDSKKFIDLTNSSDSSTEDNTINNSQSNNKKKKKNKSTLKRAMKLMSDEYLLYNASKDIEEVDVRTLF
jgi:hypothetical protein